MLIYNTCNNNDNLNTNTNDRDLEERRGVHQAGLALGRNLI